MICQEWHRHFQIQLVHLRIDFEKTSMYDLWELLSMRGSYYKVKAEKARKRGQKDGQKFNITYGFV